ncbi:MAG: hypothetical protein AABX85_00470 [Nanoarchaeota archaeon]
MEQKEIKEVKVRNYEQPEWVNVIFNLVNKTKEKKQKNGRANKD